MLLEQLSIAATAVFMLWLAVSDALRHRMPNTVILAWILCRAILILVIASVENSANILLRSLAGATVMGAAFLALYIMSKKALGAGDVKFAFGMGLSLPINHAVWAAASGFVLCGIYAAVSLLLDKENAKEPLPLGPFLFAGSLLIYALCHGA